MTSLKISRKNIYIKRHSNTLGYDQQGLYIGHDYNSWTSGSDVVLWTIVTIIHINMKYLYIYYTSQFMGR